MMLYVVFDIKIKEEINFHKIALEFPWIFLGSQFATVITQEQKGIQNWVF